MISSYFPVNLALTILILTKKADITDTDTIGTSLLSTHQRITKCCLHESVSQIPDPGEVSPTRAVAALACLVTRRC